MPSAAAPTISIAGFTPTPNHILLSPNLSPEAKLTYQIIRFHDRGRGCFACRETMAQEIGLSPYHLRKGICELVDHGIIKLEKRRMGLTDLIRLVDRDWGIPGEDSVEESIEPQIETFPEPELPGEPRLPDEPLQVEKEPDFKPVEVEEMSVELPDQISETPALNDLNYKNDYNNKNNNKHTSTGIDTIEPLNQATVEKQCDDLISHFYEQKEHREPTRNELINWRPTAKRLLSEFTFDELLPAVKNAVDQGAKLFYFTALTAPAFILGQRQQREAELHRERAAAKGKAQEEGRNRRIEEVKASATVYACEKADLLEALSQHIRPQILRSFFGDVYISALNEGSITLVAPSETIANWIADRYRSLLSEVVGREVRIVSA